MHGGTVVNVAVYDGEAEMLAEMYSTPWRPFEPCVDNTVVALSLELSERAFEAMLRRP